MKKSEKIVNTINTIIYIAGILWLIMIMLKIFGILAMGWFWVVTSPIWFALAFAFTIIILAAVAGIIAMNRYNKKMKKESKDED